MAGEYSEFAIGGLLATWFYACGFSRVGLGWSVGVRRVWIVALMRHKTQQTHGVATFLRRNVFLVDIGFGSFFPSSNDVKCRCALVGTYPPIM
jgi:hypothetical protein